MKIMISACILIAITAVGPAGASAQSFEWAIEDGGNGHQYEWIQGDYTWGESHTASIGMTNDTGWLGHLCTMTSPEERDFVHSILPTVLPGDPPLRIWIGFYQAGLHGEPDDGWYWISGEPVSFTDWRVGQPDDLGSQDFAQLFNDGYGQPYRWIDSGDEELPSDGFIMEYSDSWVTVSNSSLSRIKAHYHND